MPAGVTSAIMLRAGLNDTLILISKMDETTIATIKTLIPVEVLIKPSCGRANNIIEAAMAPIIINGFLLPPKNQLLSLMSPTIGCAIMPDKGPASHTNATSSMCKLYLVLNIQLNAATCVEKQNPTAVAGKLNKA